MSLKIIRWQIIIPTVSLVFLTGILVLMSSVMQYRDKVHNVEYERIDKAKTSIIYELSTIKEKELFAVSELAEDKDFIQAFINGDIEKLAEFMDAMLLREGLDYGLITNLDGAVVLRAHEEDRYDDNAADSPQIQRALQGMVDSDTYGNDEGPLRTATTVPIYDNMGRIRGTITLGQTMNERPFAMMLKEITECDITLYDGTIAVASTLNFPSLSNVAAYHREGIIQNVYHEGNVYKDTLNFLEGNLLSMVYPLQRSDGTIVGMLYIGIPQSGANRDIIMFTVQGGLISLILFAITAVTTYYITKIVSDKFKRMEEGMLRRDKLFRAVNQASIVLLEIDESDDIRIPLISCMEYLGSALGVDHVHLWRGQLDEKGANQFVREYSWVSDYGKRKTKTPKYINSTRDNTQLDWMDKFLKNEYIAGIISEMEESHQLLLRPLEAKSIAMIPLFLEDQFWGMFSIDNIQKARKYSEDEIDILRSISLMMANIVRRHDLQNENLKVYYDALTGINNRRYFDKTMIRTISTLSRAGSDLSLMMIDVDYFKKFNDTYGHAAGDDCLIKVAETLAQCILRVDDFVARYGGEEFVVVMPSTDKIGAIAVANRMLDSIRAAKIPHEASDVEPFVTISIGVTTGKVTQFHTSETFIQKADEMLYQSKHEGRNRFTYGDLT